MPYAMMKHPGSLRLQRVQTGLTWNIVWRLKFYTADKSVHGAALSGQWTCTPRGWDAPYLALKFHKKWCASSILVIKTWFLSCIIYLIIWRRFSCIEWKELPNDRWQGMKSKGKKGEVLSFNQHVNFIFQHSLMPP